jgi:hypothetical protein
MKKRSLLDDQLSGFPTEEHHIPDNDDSWIKDFIKASCEHAQARMQGIKKPIPVFRKQTKN